MCSSVVYSIVKLSRSFSYYLNGLFHNTNLIIHADVSCYKMQYKPGDTRCNEYNNVLMPNGTKRSDHYKKGKRNNRAGLIIFGVAADCFNCSVTSYTCFVINERYKMYLRKLTLPHFFTIQCFKSLIPNTCNAHSTMR